MKDYVNEFYKEGIGYIFCEKPIAFIKEHVKNTTLVKIFSYLIKFIFTVVVIVISGYILYKKWPF